MNRPNALFGLALCCALSACDNKITGTLKVEQPLRVYAAAGLGRKLTTLETGKYALSATTGLVTTKFTLNQDAASETVFRIPDIKGLYEKLSQDKVRLTAAELKQPFDLTLDVATNEIDRTAPFTQYERCISGYHTEYYEVWVPGETVCRYYREECTQNPGTNGDERSDFHCQQVCQYWDQTPGHYETRSREVPEYGTEEIRGYNVTHQRQAVMKILQDGEVAARMTDGHAPAVTTFVSIYNGPCN
jgi:hypothetical protein